MQQAHDLPLDAWAIADFATRLEVAKCADPEVWNLLQVKHVKAGFIFNPTRVFLAKTADLKVQLTPDFRKDLENCIDTSLLSKKRLARLLRSYAFNNPSDSFLSKQCPKLDDQRLFRLPEVLPNLYVIFWKVGTSSIKSQLEAYISRPSLEANAQLVIYLYAVKLGDSSKLGLLDKFEGRVKELNDGLITDFGKMVLTTGNFAKYREAWLKAVPTIIPRCRHDTLMPLLRTYKEFTPELDPAVHSAALALFQKWTKQQELHELVLYAKEVKGVSEKLAREMAEMLGALIRELPETEQEVLSLLLEDLRVS